MLQRNFSNHFSYANLLSAALSWMRWCWNKIKISFSRDLQVLSLNLQQDLCSSLRKNRNALLIPCTSPPITCSDDLWKVGLKEDGSEVWQHISADLYWDAACCWAVITVHVPALGVRQLPWEILVLKSLLHRSCQSGVVLLHIKNVHKPSTRAQLTSCNSLTTHLNIYNSLLKGFHLVFDPLC